jgi:hypothetical protein
MKTQKIRSKLSLDEIRSIASGYSSRKAFVVGNGRAYHQAWRDGILDDVCAHMAISPVYSHVRWTRKAVMAEARKHSSRSAFKRACGGGYTHALDNGYLDIACKHMPPTYRHWSDDDLAREAAKYSSRVDFQNGSYTAYRHANRRGLIESICVHMEGKIQWSRELALAEALKFSDRSTFHLTTPGAYKFALERGFIDEACSHMEPAKSGFDRTKPAVLYCLAIRVPSMPDLFKVGVTNRDARLRIHGMGVPSGVVVEVLEEINFPSGAEARAAEKSLHSKFRKFRYSGDRILGNGNTEIFTVNILSGGCHAGDLQTAERGGGD